MQQLTTPRTDEKGELYELHTFTSGLSVWLYSTSLHKLNYVCDLYGFDINIHADYLKAQRLIIK